MGKKFMKKAYFSHFAERLAAEGELHAPVVTDDGIVAFRRIHSAEEMKLDYSRTLLPPKKYLLPQKETILTHTLEGYELPHPADRRLILFGIHPCDLRGIAYLDSVFLQDQPDVLYSRRRNQLTLVGLSCKPDEYCFCNNESSLTLNCDIFMDKCDEGFFLTAGSEHGENLLLNISDILQRREIPKGQRTETSEAAIWTAIHGAAERGETFEDSPLWEDFGNRCLSCGACSLCCPTCYCFDVREYGRLDGKSAERVRDWDNCLFSSHGEIAGGYNFRPTRRKRFRYRFQHKYLGFGPTRGKLSCVGCGRCREVCPVRIDLLELFSHQPGASATE